MKKYLTFCLASTALVACATTPPPPPSIEEGGIQAAQEFAESLTPDCEPGEFDIYFGADDTYVSPESEAVIEAMTEIYGSCEISLVKVTGYADAVGDALVNLEVSEVRAQHVADRLVADGITAKRIDVAAVGEAEAVTNDGLAQPLSRKTVVTITP